MTSFDEATISMSLDEYYEKCVIPKPRIPKHYGFRVEGKYRKAARLRSYKENPEEDGDSEEEDAESISSIADSNTNLTNDLEDLWQKKDDSMDQTQQEDELPSNSSQWRIKKPNLNRLQGMPPLVPNDSSRKIANVQKKWRQSNYNANNTSKNKNYNNKNISLNVKKNRYNNMKNNNFNRQRQSVHNRIGFRANTNGQRVSNVFNTTHNSNIDNNNNAVNKNGFNNPQIMNSAKEICPTNFHICPPSSHIIIPHNYSSVPVSLNSNALIQAPNMCSVGFGQQLNPVYRNPPVCLADLMNIDSNNYVNINVAEVARNAIMLLSTISPQPSVGVNVQQEILQQRNNGPSQQPHGLNMNIRPETTNVPMYQCFK